MKRLAALAALRLSLYLKGRVDSAFFARYSRLISPDVTQEEIDSCPQEPEELFAGDPLLASRWRRLFDLCGGDPIAVTAIQLALLIEMDERDCRARRLPRHGKHRGSPGGAPRL